LLAQDAVTRKVLLEQLGTFLHQLHSLPGESGEAVSGPADTSPGMQEEYQELYQALELRWGLAAARSRDPAWFLCHLGYARDAWPAGWPAAPPKART
jgi:hypothetical protein